MKQFLEIGKIVNTHGIKGELKVQLWCDDYAFFKSFDKLYLDANGNSELEVVSSRKHKECALVVFKGINTVELAEKLKNKVLYCDREDAVLEDGVDFIQDLIGCNVIEIDSGKNYGKINDVLNYGSCDIYEIVSNKKKFLIPATKDIVKEKNIEDKTVKIKYMKGLFDED